MGFLRDAEFGMGEEAKAKVKLPTDDPDLVGAGSSLATSWWHGTTWGGGVRSQWTHTQREVWVRQHSVNCHPGDLRHLFLEEEEKADF